MPFPLVTQEPVLHEPPRITSFSAGLLPHNIAPQHPRDILYLLVEVRQPRPRVKFPRSREARWKGFVAEIGAAGSAAGGWGRELNLRHCHPVSNPGGALSG